jgi:subtilisin family serine protease
MKIALLVLLAVIGTTSTYAADRGARFQNLDRMIQELNLREYYQRGERAKRPVKIAIFDNGFAGAEQEIGKSLPANTRIIDGPVKNPGPEDVHGFYMARIVWSLLSLGGTDTRYAPSELLLYRTSGFTNFKEAVDSAIASRVDIVLYSQTWDYGGNFDGRGFINKIVDKALDAGILWINSSGNTGNSTYNSGIETGADDWVKLPGRNSSVELRCEKNPQGKCPLRAVLSWNDFTDNSEDGTDKDLDFVIADDTLSIVASSGLKQEKKPAPGAPGVSQYPREIITAELKPGLYFLRVKNRSKNFSARDRFRISVQGDFLSMKNADSEESVLPPADNARVISVGASDTDRSSLSRSLLKPELSAKSLVTLSKQENFKGTSNSAAMVAAGAAILLSRNPELTRAEFIRRTGFRSRGSQSQSGNGLPLSYLGFQPTGENGCFQQLDSTQAPQYIRYAVAQGGALVETNAGAKIFYPFDPIRLMPQIRRNAPNDMLVVSQAGPGIYARSGLWNMPQGMIELVQTPQGTALCGQNEQNSTLPGWTRSFRLP